MPYQTKKLGEVCEMEKGKKPSFIENGENVLPYLAAKYMRGLEDPKYASKDDKNAVVINADDIVIICDGSRSGEMFTGFSGILASTMARLNLKAEIDRGYFWNYVQQYFEEFNKNKKGAAIPHLNLEAFRNLEIPLPPLPEQKKIVKKIEELFGKIDEAQKLREQAQADAAALIPAALHQIFEKGWPKQSLGKVIELLYGRGIPKSDRDTNGKYPIFGANGELGRTNKFLVEGEALIVGRKGSAGEVTRVSGKFWPSDVTYYVFGNEKADIDFLFYLLKSLKLQKLAVGVKPGINRNRVYEIVVPFPPIQEQKKIMAYLDSLSEKAKRLQELQQQTAEDMKALKQSILHKAFSGELIK